MPTDDAVTYVVPQDAPSRDLPVDTSFIKPQRLVRQSLLVKHETAAQAYASLIRPAGPNRTGWTQIFDAIG